MKVLLALWLLTVASLAQIPPSVMDSYRIAAGANVVSAPYNLWQTFEFDSLDAANLAANDNCDVGTWSVTDASSVLSMSTSGERSLLTITDPGTRGLKADQSKNATANVKYVFPTTNSLPHVVGFWWKGDGASPGYIDWDIGGFRTSAPNDIIAITFAVGGGGTEKIKFSGTSTSAGVSVAWNTWYWITAVATAGDTSTLRVYNTSGSQVGVDQTVTANSGVIQHLGLGIYTARNLASTNYFDDILLSTNANVFPLLP